MLGVTGTNGKTTTTYLLEAIARAAGIRPGVIGTIGARIDGVPVPGERTTPEATELQALLARMVDAGVGLAAIEVSSHALVMHRVDGTRFAAACFTNLSPRPPRLPRQPRGRTSRPRPSCSTRPAPTPPPPTSTTRTAPRSPAGPKRPACRSWASGWRRRRPRSGPTASTPGPGGNRFRLVIPYGSAAVHSPLVGRFNASNALAAAATALAAGLDVDSVAAGLSAPLVVPGRMERIDAGQPFAVLVDYAHTPDGLEQVLRAARPLVGAGGGRLVVVFGCGGDRDRAKRPAMGKAAAGLADVVVVTSDNPRSEDPLAIIDEVVAGRSRPASRPVVEPDRRRHRGWRWPAGWPGDVVVVAGKGHEQGQTAGG